MNNKKIDDLCEIINYKFKNVELLEMALTHPSYQNEHYQFKKNNNQRLEFLGDAVLELVVSEELFLKNVDIMEGKLSQLRSKIVSGDALYIAAKSIDLGSYMLFGKGEFKQNGQYKASILADAMEALFGAVFLDGGFNEAKKIILLLCNEIIDEAYFGKVNTDYKTMLQEAIQKGKDKSLEYRFIEEKGPDHDKYFYYGIYVDGEEIAVGEGKSKKKAQQNGAKNALIKMGEINE